MKSTILACIFLFAASAFGQTWDVEQVDSLSIPEHVEIARAPDGSFWVAYVAQDSAVRLAHRDSSWTYENIDTTLIPRRWSLLDAPFSLSIAPDGRIGLAKQNRLVERLTSSWELDSVFSPAQGTHLAYDPFGHPALAFINWDSCACLAVRSDSGWRVSQRDIRPGSGERLQMATTARPAWTGTGVPLLTYAAYYDQVYWLFGETRALALSGDSWVQRAGLTGWESFYLPWATLVDSRDSVSICSSIRMLSAWGELMIDWSLIDGRPTMSAGAMLDSLNRVHVAWMCTSGALNYGYRTGSWHIDTVPGGGGAVCCDMVLDTLGQPVVVFEKSDGTVWLAHGIDVAGTEELPNGELRMPNAGPTVLGGASSLQRDASREFYDATGRRVTEPKAGVYFVREQGRVRKVIVTR
jgi:hypothetical protein